MQLIAPKLQNISFIALKSQKSEIDSKQVSKNVGASTQVSKKYGFYSTQANEGPV